jgi:hypothetical protein
MVPSFSGNAKKQLMFIFTIRFYQTALRSSSLTCKGTKSYKGIQFYIVIIIIIITLIFLFKRIYLDNTLLLDIIRPDVIAAVDSERSTKASSDRFAVLEDRDMMIDRESRHASIRYIINRLSYSLAKGTLIVTPDIKFLLLPTELDSSMQTPLLSEKPESLIPIPVNFRRRSNSDDIEIAINALDESHKTLKETISQAETHQKQVATIVDRAKEALGKSSIISSLSYYNFLIYIS